MSSTDALGNPNTAGGRSRQRNPLLSITVKKTGKYRALGSSQRASPDAIPIWQATGAGAAAPRWRT